MSPIGSRDYYCTSTAKDPKHHAPNRLPFKERFVGATPAPMTNTQLREK